jgi:hypothetical protein
MSLINAALTTSIANIYVSSGNTVISAMYFCNYSASTVSFNLYAVPTATVASNSNIIYSAIQLAAGDTYVVDWEKLVLSNGDTLQANATSSTSITSTISYIGV